MCTYLCTYIRKSSGKKNKYYKLKVAFCIIKFISFSKGMHKSTPPYHYRFVFHCIHLTHIFLYSRRPCVCCEIVRIASLSHRAPISFAFPCPPCRRQVGSFFDSLQNAPNTVERCQWADKYRFGDFGSAAPLTVP